MDAGNRGNFLFALGAAILVFAVSFLVIEAPQLEVGLPLHSDSYDNIAAVQASISGQKISHGSPYSNAYINKTGDEIVSAFDIEAGYTAALAAFSLFSGIDIIALSIFLPWLVSMLIFISSFILIGKLTKNNFISFAGAMFVFLLPSTQQTLGPAFLVASNLGLAVLPLVIYFGVDVLSERKNVGAFVFIAIASAVIYPPAFIVAAIALVSFAVATQALLKKNFKLIIFSFIAILVLAVFGIMLFIFLSGLNPLRLFSEYGFEFVFAAADFAFDQLLFRQNMLPEVPFVPGYLGIVLFGFCGIAVLYFASLDFFRKGNSNIKIVYAPAVVLLLMAFGSIQIGRGILVPTERLVFFSAYFFLLCGGILFAEIANKVAGFLSSKKILNEETKRYFFSFSLLLLASAIVLSQPLKTESLQLNMTNEEMDGVGWIRENTGRNDFILAAPYLSKPIYVFTGRNVACTSSTRFGCSNELNILAASFFFAGCEDKKRILSGYFRADYVFMEKELTLAGKTIKFPAQDCDFMEKSFEGKNIIIYKINKNFISGSQ